MMRHAVVALLFVVLLPAGPVVSSAAPAGRPHIELTESEEGQLRVLIEGREALVYQYGKDLDAVHCYPIRSPSGKLLTTTQDQLDPHHRSFWFGDIVQFAAGPQVSFYAPLYSRIDKDDPKSPFRDQVRHVKFLERQVTATGAEIDVRLLCTTDQGKTPMLDEVRRMRVVPLGDGEYFLDCRFTVTAAYGDVNFVSDEKHYAWPYVRMHPQFAVERLRFAKDEKGKSRKIAEKGTGTITNSAGAVNEKGTLMQPARWVDYSAEVAGTTEGLTIFADPAEPPPRFFTRDYGCFGPRRPDAQSGKPFVLHKGASLAQRVGILVHKGDVREGKVAQRYELFATGRL